MRACVRAAIKPILCWHMPCSPEERIRRMK
jgi:hypothetical protein